MHYKLSAIDAARKIKDGEISSVELVKSCLQRIEETDGQVRAWAHLDPEYALAQAAKLDAIRYAGRPMGALHGVPVGLKDIVDTKDQPTQRGSSIFAGRRPKKDAAIVERLIDAGAVIMGKTVTTELAFVHANETRNPHNPEYSPGGSSSGSVAAIAALQIPLAIGTQTNGSVVRPASFCGVYGFKPTNGVISRRGLLETSKSLDQLGTFARNLEDAALLVDVIAGYDPSDQNSYARPRPKMLVGAGTEVPEEPSLVWLDLPFNNRLSDDARSGLDRVMNGLGARVKKMPAPSNFSKLVDVQGIIHQYEICHHLEKEFADHWDQISETLKPVIEHGRTISDGQYQDALSEMEAAKESIGAIFQDFDAIISPSATGEAPIYSNFTGDPIFCTIWTLVGLPALNLPLLEGGNGLPIGVQLIGAAEKDDDLLRTAHWVVQKLQPMAD